MRRSDGCELLCSGPHVLRSRAELLPVELLPFELLPVELLPFQLWPVELLPFAFVLQPVALLPVELLQELLRSGPHVLRSGPHVCRSDGSELRRSHVRRSGRFVLQLVA